MKDIHGIISQCCVRGYDIQNILIIERLIREEACSFFIYDGEKKRIVSAKTSRDGTTFLTTDPNGSDMDTLNFLPLIDKPLLKKIIESAC